jgi:hypothetical protein
MPRKKPARRRGDVLDREIDLVCRALRAALTAAQGARVLPAGDVAAAGLRASRFWCGVAATHLEQAIAAAAGKDS